MYVITAFSKDGISFCEPVIDSRWVLFDDAGYQDGVSYAQVMDLDTFEYYIKPIEELRDYELWDGVENIFQRGDDFGYEDINFFQYINPTLQVSGVQINNARRHLEDGVLFGDNILTVYAFGISIFEAELDPQLEDDDYVCTESDIDARVKGLWKVNDDIFGLVVGYTVITIYESDNCDGVTRGWGIVVMLFLDNEYNIIGFTIFKDSYMKLISTGEQCDNSIVARINMLDTLSCDGETL